MEHQIEEMNQNQIEEDYLFKIVMIGDCAVGKSNILSRFIIKKFNQESRSTIGIELSTKVFKVDSKIIKLNIWDTAGQERFSSITNAYYKGTYGAFIVYDITRRDTFLSIDKWLNELRSKISNSSIALIIIGNKSDLTLLRQVSYDEAKQKADKLSIDIIYIYILLFRLFIF